MRVYIVYFFATDDAFEIQGVYESERRAQTEVMRLGKYYAYEGWNVV